MLGFFVLLSGCQFFAEPSEILVLRYDKFSESKTNDIETVSRKKFERDIKYLKENGYNPVSLQKLNAFLGGRGRLPSKPLLITFDNGWESQYSIAFPILKKYHFQAVLFPYSGQIGVSGKLSWEVLRKMFDAEVFEIGAKGDHLYQKSQAIGETTGGISLNFDDAWRSVYDNAFPILKEKGITATVFTITDMVKKKEPQYLNISQLKKLEEAGWEIGSHTISHKDLAILKKDELTRELRDSKEFLVNEGFWIESIAMPFGLYDSQVIKETLKYYSNIRTVYKQLNLLSAERLVDGVVLRKDIDMETIKNRIEEAKAKKAWLVLVFHQIDNSGKEFAVSPDIFRKIVDEVAKSELPVFTLAAAKGRPLIFRQQSNLVIESDQMYQKRIVSDFAKTKKIFKDKLGEDPQFLAYPYGTSYEIIQKSAKKAGYKGAFTSIAGFNKKLFYPFEIQRIQVTEDLILADILE
jgi:peptidoglycan/xylan/chitin deacetylase (PgdA/CDA1 family)